MLIEPLFFETTCCPQILSANPYTHSGTFDKREKES